MRKVLATLMIGGLMAFGAPDAAEAQVVTGGLVNVTVVDLVDVGDVTILENVGIGVAVNAALALCPGVQLGAAQVGIIARQVARGDQEQVVVCEVEGGDLDGGTVVIER